MDTAPYPQCPNCGARCSEGWRFCRACGHRLGVVTKGVLRVPDKVNTDQHSRPRVLQGIVGGVAFFVLLVALALSGKDEGANIPDLNVPSLLGQPVGTVDRRLTQMGTRRHTERIREDCASSAPPGGALLIYECGVYEVEVVCDRAGITRDATVTWKRSLGASSWPRILTRFGIDSRDWPEPKRWKRRLGGEEYWWVEWENIGRYRRVRVDNRMLDIQMQ